MPMNEEEFAAFQARRKNYELDKSKPDDFVCSGQGAPVSPRKSATTQRKWNPTPTDENRRSDDWLGGSPTGQKPRRSWKVKEVKDAVPAPSDD